MTPDIDRELQILSEISSGAHVTQRSLAKKLGIALGFTNLLIRRLAKKGSIKIVNIQRNRVRYLLTAGGIAEKARLTYEYLQYSLQFYHCIRTVLTEALRQRPASATQRVLLYGTGEIAEIAYLVIQQLGLTVVGVVDASANRRPFFRYDVQPLSSLGLIPCDVIIVASLTDRNASAQMLIASGVAAERLIAIPDVPELFRMAKSPQPAPVAQEPAAVASATTLDSPADTTLESDA